MTIEELGMILGDAISELQRVSIEADETVDILSSIDGKVILLDETDNKDATDQPYMTVEELDELVGNALNELESVAAAIGNASDLLQSINGSMFSVGTAMTRQT